MKTLIFAIDPGTTESAYVVYDPETNRIEAHGKAENLDVLCFAGYKSEARHLVIEEISSYGKPVGKEVFDTVLWCGRFIEAWESHRRGRRSPAYLLERRKVKMHLCQSAASKDSHVRQRLIDIFGPEKDKAIGKTPQPLYGIKADEWQALGLAITFAETELTER